MIQTIEGRIGGGKTYTAVGWICNHLAKGGVVATNINIQINDFSDQYGTKRGLKYVLSRFFRYEFQDEQLIFLSDSELVDYPTSKGVVPLNAIVMFYKKVPRGTPEKPVLVVIDEAHIHFPQDGYRSIPREVLHFLTLSRHASVDVVFISQHIKNMWCQMLRLAQFRWGIRDMKKYGLPFGLFNLPWPFPHFLQMKYDYDGSTIMSRKFEWHRKYLYECYKSPELASAFESMPCASSVEVKKRKLTMQEKYLLFASGVLVGLLAFAVPACRSHSAVSLPSEPSPEKGESAPVPPVVPVSAPSTASVPERVTMFINQPGRVILGTVRDGQTRFYRLGGYFQGRQIIALSDSSVTLQDDSGHTETLRF